MFQESEYFTSFNEGDDVEHSREERKRRMVEISERPDIYEVAITLFATTYMREQYHRAQLLTSDVFSGVNPIDCSEYL